MALSPVRSEWQRWGNIKEEDAAARSGETGWLQHDPAMTTQPDIVSASPSEPSATILQVAGDHNPGPSTMATAVKRPWYHPLVIVNYLIEQWFIIGIGVVIVLAWRFPEVAKDDGSEYPFDFSFFFPNS